VPMSTDACDVSGYFPERYDEPYNMAKHKVYGAKNKKLNEYVERRCAESELVEDIRENFCTIGQIQHLVEIRRQPRAKLKAKLDVYKSFKDKHFAERHEHFSKKVPCEALAIKVSAVTKLTERNVWLELHRDPALAEIIWPDFKDKLLPSRRSGMINYVETTAEANAMRQLKLNRGYGRWRNDKIYRPGINYVDLDLDVSKLTI